MTKNHEEESENTRPLQAISRGFSLFFIGKITENGLGFLFNLILTQILGAALYGIYSYGNSIMGFLIVLARLGTGKSLLRFIPAHDDDPPSQNTVTALAYVTALFGSFIIGTALFLAAPFISKQTLNEPLLVNVLRIFALVLPFNTVTNLTNAVFRALERLEYQVLIQNIINPLVRIISVSAAFVLGYALIGAVAAIAIGMILTCCSAVSFLYFKTDIRPIGRRTHVNIPEFYNYSLPLTMKDIGQKLYTRVDILMVGFFLTGSAVGIYRISILIATLLTLPLAGVNQLFPPIASGLHADGERGELESTYQVVTRWVFTLALPATIAVIVYNSELLQVFGEGFTDGTVVLSLFAVAQLTNCAVGPSGFLLMMTDHQYLNLANQWLLGILNVILNYFLILEYGFIGAAVATAGTLTLINFIRVIEVWYVEQMYPYSLKYWKPVLAGTLGALVMLGWRFLFEGYFLLVIGSLSGFFVFTATLFFAGIEKEDQRFFEESIKPRLE